MTDNQRRGSTSASETVAAARRLTRNIDSEASSDTDQNAKKNTIKWTGLTCSVREKIKNLPSGVVAAFSLVAFLGLFGLGVAHFYGPANADKPAHVASESEENTGKKPYTELTISVSATATIPAATVAVEHESVPENLKPAKDLFQAQRQVAQGFCSDFDCKKLRSELNPLRMYNVNDQATADFSPVFWNGYASWLALELENSDGRIHSYPNFGEEIVNIHNCADDLRKQSRASPLLRMCNAILRMNNGKSVLKSHNGLPSVQWAGDLLPFIKDVIRQTDM